MPHSSSRILLLTVLLFTMIACQRAKVAPASELPASTIVAEDSNDIDAIDEEDPADTIEAEPTLAEDSVEEPVDDPTGEMEDVEEEEEEESEELYEEESE